MPAQFVTLPVFLCGAASLAISAVLIGLPSRERLAEQNAVPWRLLTAALIMATGLKGAQWTALNGLTPLPAPYWAADWAVTFALTFTFLFWYPRHATGRAAHITLALLLTVILAQFPLWHWTTLPAAAYVTAAGLLLLGGAVSLGGSLLLRQVNGGAFPIGVISVSQGLLITLVTLAFTAPLHALSSTAPLTPSLTASWMKAMFLITAFSLIVREVQVRRARRFQQQIHDKTAALQREQDLHVALIESLNDQVVICDVAGQLVGHNSRASKLHERNPIGTFPADWAQTYGLHTTNFSRFLHLEEIPLYRALQGEQVRDTLIGVQTGQTRRVVTCNANPIRNAQGTIIGAVVAMNDVTDREQARQELERTAARHAHILNSLDEGLLMLDLDGRILSFNDRVSDLLGVNAASAKHFADLLTGSIVRDVNGQRLPMQSVNFTRMLSGQASVADSVVEIIRADGTSRWVRNHVQGIYQDQKLSSVLYTMVDITSQTQLNSELQRVTRYASISGLPNREYFEQLAAAVPDAPERTLLVLRCLNITQLRTMQQIRLAEKLTVRFTRSLQDSYPDALLFGQLDEQTFAAVLPHAAADLHPDLLTPVTVDGEQLFPRVSACARLCPASEDIGVAVHETEGALENAPLGTLLPFETRHVEELRRALLLESRLQLALRTLPFTVHYQPIVNLDTGRLVKAEALIRWTDEQLGFVPPDQFIPVAEQMGQIQVITDFVVQAALTEARRASAALGCPFRIAVNLSPVELNAPDFMDRIRHLMHCEPDAPEHLGFEVTEGGVLEHLDVVSGHLQQLRDWGFGLALDDFGTGYSALSVLQHLPIHHLKLDRTFVWGIGGNEKQRVVTAAVVDLAARLNVDVICEGIETLEHEGILRSMQCALGQGYLYSRPLPSPDWSALDTSTALHR
ncbi:EAL domain-containing protein [Deinococcus sp. 14RED07]|uniref:GGDEF domain-containing phosphodiesterase n=1 Tax=Deinococcus sp. 14RED07 TaxID=2745874 RepID=UPI001E2FC3F9|nr:GGDEF domain-containing phosphodiesterase [Deinococcus sp. 14RED07]MCD0174583.1 EAL domain-containing protein [Deinococcus sp. 14RED07]